MKERAKDGVGGSKKIAERGGWGAQKNGAQKMVAKGSTKKFITEPRSTY